MPGQSERKRSPLHNRQGDRSFREGAEGGSTSDSFVVDTTFPLGDFFFLVFVFFFLATWLVKSKVSPGEVEDEDAAIGEEGKGSTLESTWCCSGGGGGGGTIVITLETTEFENNHTGKPMVNPGKDNVAIY